MKQVIDISWESIARVVITLLAFWLVWIIKDVLALFFIILVIVAALTPIVDNWSRHMPRIAAVLGLYSIIIAVLLLAASIIFPPLVHEISELTITLPEFAINFQQYFGDLSGILGVSSQQLEALTRGISNISTQLYSTTLGIISSVLGLFTIGVVTFYLLIDREEINKLINSFIPNHKQARVTRTVQEISAKMGAWLRGQLLLALMVGFIDFVGLLIIGVPFALTLGVWAALTEVIPYIGPVLGAIPAIFIALLVSPIKGLFALILFIIVQQIEANVLVPRVMSKAVGLSPVVIIFAILIGAKLDGIIGVILAIPVAAAISVIIKELFGGKIHGSHRS